MSDLFRIQMAIEHFKNEADAESNELMIVMGPVFREQLLKAREEIIGKPMTSDFETVFGVEIVVREELDKVKDIEFGIVFKTCRDHLEDHFEELGIFKMDDGETIETVQYINCKDCGHPIGIDLFDAEGVAYCPWCGDKNVLQIIDIIDEV